jgi:hypothetical protein
MATRMRCKRKYDSIGMSIICLAARALPVVLLKAN